MSADELRQDLEELRRLEGLAKQPRVQSLLANEIHNVDAKVSWGPISFTLFSRAQRLSHSGTRTTQIRLGSFLQL
jgi:hypothetical protein